MSPKPAPPAARAAAPEVSTDLLAVDAGWMVQARYGPQEYCQPCAEIYRGFYPDAQRRTVSLYEILTSWREYRCTRCRKKLWNPEDHR